jgi:hypothetical protein
MATVERLIEVDAEALVGEVVGPTEVSVAVLTPGAWTHRWFTDVEYRVHAPPLVWFWAGDTVDAAGVLDCARSTIARLADERESGPVESLRALARREGKAMRARSTPPSPCDVSAANVAIEVMGDDRDMGSYIAWVHGDDAAKEIGYQGLGVNRGTGLRWSWEQAS